MLYNAKGKIARAHPYSLDKTLRVEGSGAEAQATGEAIAKAKQEATEHTNKHVNNTENPHKVTANQIGLGNVNNTSDEDKPVSTAQAEAINEAKQVVMTALEEAKQEAMTAADEAKTAADNAQTAADEAKTEAENALSESKAYTDNKHLSCAATLTTEWTGEEAPYTQVVTVEGILADDNPHVAPVYSDGVETALQEKEAWSMVSKGKTADNSITFVCFENKPETAINIQIEVNR